MSLSSSGSSSSTSDGWATTFSRTRHLREDASHHPARPRRSRRGLRTAHQFQSAMTHLHYRCGDILPRTWGITPSASRSSTARRASDAAGGCSVLPASPPVQPKTWFGLPAGLASLLPTLGPVRIRGRDRAAVACPRTSPGSGPVTLLCHRRGRGHGRGPRSGGLNVDCRRDRTHSRKFSHSASVSFLRRFDRDRLRWCRAAVRAAGGSVAPRVGSSRNTWKPPFTNLIAPSRPRITSSIGYPLIVAAVAVSWQPSSKSATTVRRPALCGRRIRGTARRRP